MGWSRHGARWSLRLTPTALTPAAVALAVLAVSLRWRGFVHPDVVIQQEAAGVLLSQRWAETYLSVPKAQMGPLAVVLITMPHDLYLTLTSLLVLPFLTLARPIKRSRAQRIVWCTASAGLVVPWSQFAWKGHADDALVLCCAATGLWAYERHQPKLTVAAFVVGMAVKPTAALLAPLLSWEGLLIGTAATVLLWAPFAWSDPPGFLRAGRGVMHVAPQSLWGRIGLAAGAPPGWLRPSQLVLGLGTALWVRARRHVSVAVLAAFTLRSLMEMTPAPAYAASLVALALVADAREARVLPMFTILALVAFWTSQPALNGASGWPRIAAHVALLALTMRAAMAPPNHEPAPTMARRPRADELALRD
jgi:hypothetical protein